MLSLASFFTSNHIISQLLAKTSPRLEYNVQNIAFHKSYHGTVIRTGITCQEIASYMGDSVAGGLLLKRLKYFEVMLNIFEFSRV